MTAFQIPTVAAMEAYVSSLVVPGPGRGGCLFTGTEAPVSIPEAANGSLYLDKTTGILYELSDPGLIDTAGGPGVNLYVGHGPPVVSPGMLIGDVYLDVDTHVFYEYEVGA